MCCARPNCCLCLGFCHLWNGCSNSCYLTGRSDCKETSTGKRLSRNNPILVTNTIVSFSDTTRASLKFIVTFLLSWQPTPVFMSGKSHGPRSLVGYSPWGLKESDTTEWLHFLLPAQIERISHFLNLMPTEMFDTMILLEIQIKLSQNYYLHLRHWNN